MKNLKFFGFALLIPFVSSSCTREENNAAGKGGAAILTCIPKHHDISKNIVNGKVYIAYNTADIPASYDDSVSCVLIDGVPTATFSGLKTGTYYLLGTGYDTSINQAVKGGLSYSISQETALEITVPVTETHL